MKVHFATLLFLGGITHPLTASKRLREPFKPWTPDTKEQAALEGTIATPCQGITLNAISHYTIISQTLHFGTGRRGLLNLGQTCYMNVILQSFIANPLLRNYYLSDKHNSRLCRPQQTQVNCTSCEMDKLLAEVGMPRLLPLLKQNLALPHRSIPRTVHHMAPSIFSRRHGGRRPKYPAMHSMMPTSSSLPR